MFIIHLAIPDVDSVVPKFGCANLASISLEHRCLYEKGESGLLIGCRDASHLVDCGE